MSITPRFTLKPVTGLLLKVWGLSYRSQEKSKDENHAAALTLGSHIGGSRAPETGCPAPPPSLTSFLLLPGEKDVVVLGDFGQGPDSSDHDILRKEKFHPLISAHTFTNISTKNPQGSKSLDNVWISKSLKKVFTGKAEAPGVSCLDRRFQVVGVVCESGVSDPPLRSFTGLSCVIIIQTEPLLGMKVGVTSNDKASPGLRQGDTERVPGRPSYGDPVMGWGAVFAPSWPRPLV